MPFAVRLLTPHLYRLLSEAVLKPQVEGLQPQFAGL